MRSFLKCCERVGLIILLIFAGGFRMAHAAERINHAGRILGQFPIVTNAVLFNTPEADAIVARLQVFPRDNPWNEDISRRPVLSNSEAMVSQIMANLSSSRRGLRAFTEMNFVVVPDTQPLVPIDLFMYEDESDPGPYPIPPNMPVETWPAMTGNLSLYDWQRDINGTGGDRHAIIVQPGTGGIWETWSTRLEVMNGVFYWHAANGARFNMNSNALRPDGWTSADAAGLSMFAGLVRYDECERGMVEHALRLVVARTRREYIYPATHYASSYTTPNLPAMGQRLRLKSNFVIPSTWTKAEQAVLRALKKYGAIVADNGNFLSISVVPDLRLANAFPNLSSVSVTNFEVIVSTGAFEGPRSPGAPTVDAGVDQTTNPGVAVTLPGVIHYSGPVMPAVRWYVYEGPASVAWSATNRSNTTVTFHTNGVYTLMFSADDGVHTPVYDAVVVRVEDGLRMQVRRQPGLVQLSWVGGVAPFRVEGTPSFPAKQWEIVATTNTQSIELPLTGPTAFFRVIGQAR